MKVEALEKIHGDRPMAEWTYMYYDVRIAAVGIIGFLGEIVFPAWTE